MQFELSDFDAVFAVIKRQWRVVAVSVFTAILLGAGYLATAVPLYTASAKVLIDRTNGQVVEQLSTVGAVADEEASVLSQVEVLKSDTIALAVVDKLNLTENPQFNSGSGSIMGAAVGAIRSVLNIGGWFAAESETDAKDEADRKRQLAADTLLRNLDVSRLGRTYVLEVEYTSVSAQLSADVANTIASEYLLDKLNSKYEATRRASDWLSDRIAELRQKALETDLAVQKFRATNGLVQAGNGLVSDQQLSELNSALIAAQSDTAKARARLQRIETILSSDEVDAVVTDILDSTVANDLRKKYLESSKTEAEISARLGRQHVQAVRLRNEMQEYKRLMFEEVSRVAQSYKSDLEVDAAREQQLRESVEQASNVSSTASETQVQLRELQRESETYKNLYQTFLQRYQEAVQQQSFPVTEARVISNATPPNRASSPVKPLILAFFTLLGGVVGMGVGAGREFRDRFFRTGDQVREVLGQEFLGNVNEIDGKPVSNAADGFDKSRAVLKTSSVSDYVIEYPLSSMAETLRSARLAIDLNLPSKQCRVIGVVSTLPGEGKSTISANLAELLANQGAKTVLIDADIRNPGSTRAMGRHAKAGLLEVLLDGVDYRDALLFNQKTGLAFLPTVVKQRVTHSSELLMSGAMRKLLSDLSAEFDYVIVDLPPLGPVIDARAIGTRMDGFIFVVEWGQTARRAVRNVLVHEPVIRDKCLGVILNRVDLEKLKLYRAYGSGDYYNSRYTGYYHDEK
ncbi:polysaccharide biosynthesis tyrosine autokinase [Agrobacterium sp. NPDC090273]|uniref:polysaccharide biosynthesis tyrosine autokinase n=1 Tax=Agrobacterium sp. NPDC090273 TaxID=3363919 RepID=UPI00383A3006